MKAPAARSGALRTWGVFSLLLAGLAGLFMIEQIGQGAAGVASVLAPVLLLLGLVLLALSLRRAPEPHGSDQPSA